MSLTKTRIKERIAPEIHNSSEFLKKNKKERVFCILKKFIHNKFSKAKS